MTKWGARCAEEAEDEPVALPAAALLSRLSPPADDDDDDEEEELCLCSASILSTETKNNVTQSWNNFSKICSVVQGGPSGMRLYFVDLDFGMLPAMPILPDLQHPKQNPEQQNQRL